MNDGSGHIVMGSLGKTRPPWEIGKPLKHSSASDEDIICHLVARFHSSNRLVFLTENRKGDVHGVARLLTDFVEPALRAQASDRFGLLTVFKKGRRNGESMH